MGIVPDLIPRGEITILVAASGVGRSLICSDLYRALICGSKWFGIDVPKMRVLILQLEDGGGCIDRLKAHVF